MVDKDKNIGVSLFGQSDEYLIGADPIEEIFALNLGDFLSEHLISEDLAKKIGNKEKNKKDRLIKQLKELVSIYSMKNTLCVLNFDNRNDYAVYTAIAHSIVQMLEVEKCNIYLDKTFARGMSNPDFDLILVGSSLENIRRGGFKYSEKSIISVSYMEADTISANGITAVPMCSNSQKVGVIAIEDKKANLIAKSYLTLLESIAGLFAASMALQTEIDIVNHLIEDKDSAIEAELKHSRAELTAQIGDLCDYQQRFVENLARAVDTKGHYTVSHSKNTAELAKRLCKQLKLNEKTTDLIYYAGLLQNIGKIMLPEKMFSSTEKYTPEELKMMQEQSNIGVNLLMNINFLSEVVPYVTYQKERFDGSGSPEGLKGMSIPFGSRIIAVADAFCAMTTDRPYRKAMTVEKALLILREEAGKKWDPDVVNALALILNF